MLPSKAQFHCNGNPFFTAPGKVFLLGEYAALAGSPAIVAAVSPRFKIFPSEAADASCFHPQSPFARLVQWAGHLGVRGSPFYFEDPYSGRGGFGASTAQFALGYRTMADQGNWDLGWQKVWGLYRELMANQAVIPSGADLAAQWLGGVVCFDQRGYEGLWDLFDWSQVMVFSSAHQTGRKTATHEHLGKLEVSRLNPIVSDLRTVVEKGLSAIRSQDPQSFGQAMTAYAEHLAQAGLECAQARADRLALSRLPGVLGIKGSGALLSDAVILLAEPDPWKREAVIAVAEARNLKLVSAGLTCEEGIS